MFHTTYFRMTWGAYYCFSIGNHFELLNQNLWVSPLLAMACACPLLLLQSKRIDCLINHCLPWCDKVPIQSDICIFAHTSVHRTMYYQPCITNALASHQCNTKFWGATNAMAQIPHIWLNILAKIFSEIHVRNTLCLYGTKHSTFFHHGVNMTQKQYVIISVLATSKSPHTEEVP